MLIDKIVLALLTAPFPFESFWLWYCYESVKVPPSSGLWLGLPYGFSKSVSCATEPFLMISVPALDLTIQDSKAIEAELKVFPDYLVFNISGVVIVPAGLLGFTLSSSSFLSSLIITSKFLPSASVPCALAYTDPPG